MDPETYTHWGSGKYKVMEFSKGLHTIAPCTLDNTMYKSSEFIFCENDMIFKTNIIQNDKNNEDIYLPQKHYLLINLATGHDNEWYEHRSCTNWEGCKNGMKSSSIQSEAYQVNALSESITLYSSPYYMINFQDTHTQFYQSMIHTTKKILLSRTRKKDSLFTTWHIFYLDLSNYHATYPTPLYAHQLGTIPELKHETTIDTACFTPDGKTIFVFLKNGTILKIVPEQPTRVTPKAYDAFFRWK
jgi:hypothetical protein